MEWSQVIPEKQIIHMVISNRLCPSETSLASQRSHKSLGNYNSQEISVGFIGREILLQYISTSDSLGEHLASLLVNYQCLPFLCLFSTHPNDLPPCFFLLQ